MSKIFESKKKDVQKSEIDPRIYNRVLSNLQFAEDVSAIPYEPYRGMMVAPFTRDYMEGEAATRRIAREGGFVPEVEAAARNAQGLMGYQPERVSAGRTGTQFGARDIGGSLARGPERISAGRVGTQFAPSRVSAGRVGTTFGARDVGAPGAAPMAQGASVLGRDIGEYMNPYERQVIDAGLGDISRAEEQARGGRASRATSARAFGGSRAAIEEGIAAGEAARERNRYVAEQRAQGFREASAQREADVGREQATRLSNQSAAQNVMELAQRGQITNQQRDIELARLGLTGETANVDAQMRADLENQRAAQEAQRLGAAAEQFNVETDIRAGTSNQQAMQEYMRMGLSAEEANQRAQLDAQRMSSTAEQFNEQQRMEAARANQAAGAQGAEFRLRAGSDLAGYGQTALENRYGAGRAMMGLGTQQQQLYQNFLNAQREEDFRRQQYPLQQLAIRQGAVSASPMNTTNTTTVTGRPSYFDMGMRLASAIPMGGAPPTPVPPPGSDERMKRNIGGIKNPLDKVRRLKGIEFEWENGYGENEGEDKGGEEDMGMSAQSVERAMPSAVSRRESDNMRQYDLPQVVGLLTEAVKELDKKVGAKRRGRA